MTARPKGWTKSLRKDYRSGKFTNAQLIDKYGLHLSTASNAMKRSFCSAIAEEPLTMTDRLEQVRHYLAIAEEAIARQEVQR
jgi:hypothetical protein